MYTFRVFGREVPKNPYVILHQEDWIIQTCVEFGIKYWIGYWTRGIEAHPAFFVEEQDVDDVKELFTDAVYPVIDGKVNGYECTILGV